MIINDEHMLYIIRAPAEARTRASDLTPTTRALPLSYHLPKARVESCSAVVAVEHDSTPALGRC